MPVKIPINYSYARRFEANIPNDSEEFSISEFGVRLSSYVFDAGLYQNIIFSIRHKDNIHNLFFKKTDGKMKISTGVMSDKNFKEFVEVSEFYKEIK